MTQVTQAIDLDRILALYERFAPDLARVRRYQSLLYEERFDDARTRERAARLRELAADDLIPIRVGHLSSAQLDDIACEITYLLIRDERPQNVVEISPCGGWSSSWILNALHDNGCGHLTSFDLIDHSEFKVPRDLRRGYRTFHLGDVTQTEHLPDDIDFLFMDSDHGEEFTHWYVQNVFPRVRSGAPVLVDDVFQPEGIAQSGGEGPVVLDWLQQRDVPHFTVAESEDPQGLLRIGRKKQELGLLQPIVRQPGVNPALWFSMP